VSICVENRVFGDGVVITVCFFAKIVYVEVLLVFICVPFFRVICPLYFLLCYVYGLSPVCVVRSWAQDSVLLTEGSILGPCYKFWE
jgi:hypothetical protein